MNGLELTKSQKKIARQVIEKGLQKEYIDGIIKLDNIISKWKINVLTNRDAWFELCKELTKHDDHIANRYNNMGGSKYLYVIPFLHQNDPVVPMLKLRHKHTYGRNFYVLNG